MSKSLGNTLTIRDLVTRHDPAALRLFLLGTHYRSPLEWAEERVRGQRARARAAAAPDRRGGASTRRTEASAPPRTRRFPPICKRSGSASPTRWTTTSIRREALAALHRPESGAALGGGEPSDGSCAGAQRAEDARPAPSGLQAGPVAPASTRRAIDRLIAERAEARRQKNFKRADEIRAEIEQLGAILEDKPGSTGWRWKGR